MCQVTITNDVRCPMCGAQELTDDGKRLNIRAHKVQDMSGQWMSQCLVCKDNGDDTEGWFKS